MKHALVTGASGFIGHRLSHLLQQRGVQVSALHRREQDGPWQRQLLIDLAQQGAGLDLPQDIDTVFHLAGNAHADDGDGSWEVHQAISVQGTRRLLAALGPAVKRFIYFSSVKAMGESTPAQGVDESAPCHPTTAYGRARLQAEGLVIAAACDELGTTVLRLPLVYGAGVGGNLDRMLRSVRARRMPRLPALGNRRSMIHVDDVCEAALLLAQAPGWPARTYLLSDGQDYEPHALVSMMYAACGRGPLLPPVPAWSLILAARIGDLLHSAGVARVPFSSRALRKLRGSAVYDASAIMRDTGFQPRYRLQQVLPAMLAALHGESPR